MIEQQCAVQFRIIQGLFYELKVVPQTADVKILWFFPHLIDTILRDSLFFTRGLTRPANPSYAELHLKSLP